jgi:uncharacterized membrane protein YphA (DoxX/SURF4 family)
MKHLVTALRVVFGAWMLFNGLNFFVLHLYPMPTGDEPLGAQLMAAFVHSKLLDVAMAMELVAGALILCGVLTPVALCVLMPVSTCAVYWAVVLEHDPVLGAAALAAFALNGLLMLAYIDYYRGALARRAVALGEA